MTVTPTYITEANSLTTSPLVELFQLDATGLGDKVYYLTNSNPENPYNIANAGSANGVIFGGIGASGGNNYISFPLELTGVDEHGDGTASGKPVLSVSNVNRYFLNALTSLGDMVGVRVTRIRTFYMFCNYGSSPDPTQIYPMQSWVITQKAPSSKNNISWNLSSYLDRPGVKLPRLQIFVDSVAGQTAFPGVSRILTK